jgi:TM2 domain-containing membrane protein YozV
MKNQFFAAILSIIMPGLGQLYNRQFFKSLLVLVFELVANKLAHVNSALVLTMNGHYADSLERINYDYALFYPGFLIFAVYDAVLCSKVNPNKNSAIWFALSGLFGTFGIIYGKYIPIPVFSVGLIMIISMLVGTYVCSRGPREQI